MASWKYPYRIPVDPRYYPSQQSYPHLQREAQPGYPILQREAQPGYPILHHEDQLEVERTPAPHHKHGKWSLIIGLAVVLLIIAVPSIILPIYYTDDHYEKLDGPGGMMSHVCDGHPCGMGECLPVADHDYTCKCPTGWMGDHCEHKDNHAHGDCSDETCRHGTCINARDGFFCFCEEGYEGLHCDMDVDECKHDNGGCGGICQNQRGGFSCSCPRGSTLNIDGKHCIANSACEEEPCARGECLDDGHGGFKCECPNGYHGATCAEDNNECEDGRNGGCSHICTNGNGMYECSCPDGLALSGNRHDCYREDACDGSPCDHGQCVQSSDDYLCLCDAGYDGRNCDHDINECAESPRFCDGGCVNTRGSYRCTCPGEHLTLGENGHSCVSSDVCGDHPCDHGICVKSHEEFACICDSGFDGKTCSHDIDECAGTPICDGICTNTRGGYECDCPPGKILHSNGHSCVDVAECASNPCGPHGLCLESDDGYTCHCDHGYVGDSCQTEICDIGWMYFEHTGHCYRYFSRVRDEESSIGLDAYEAEAACIARGGHLWSINDDDELDWVHQNIILVVNGQYHRRKRHSPDSEIWVGLLIGNGQTSTWKWTDGSPLDGNFVKSLFLFVDPYFESLESLEDDHLQSGYSGEHNDGDPYCAEIDTEFVNVDGERHDVLQVTHCTLAHWHNYICEKPSNGYM